MSSLFKKILAFVALVGIACSYPVTRPLPIQADQPPSEVALPEIAADPEQSAPSDAQPLEQSATLTMTATATITETATVPASPTATATFTPSATSTDIPTPAPTNTHTPAPTNTSAPLPTNTQPPPPPPPANTAAPQSCAPAINSSVEKQIIKLINAERKKKGLGVLTANGALRRAARGHSKDMACNNFFSHTSPTTGSPFDRMAAEGYSYSWAGENIAAGYGTAADVVEGWMQSQGHRDNILNANFTEIGVGHVYWADSEYGSYTTTVFGSP